jgi:hypothetical protein
MMNKLALIWALAAGVAPRAGAWEAAKAIPSAVPSALAVPAPAVAIPAAAPALPVSSLLPQSVSGVAVPAEASPRTGLAELQSAEALSRTPRGPSDAGSRRIMDGQKSAEGSADAAPAAPRPDVAGVWNLVGFDLVDARGETKPWCEGAYGAIIYAGGYMSVAINCASDPTKMLHYSGPYHVEGQTVVHEVRNFSDPKLKQATLKRSIEMPDPDHLDLIGPLPDGGKAVVRWRRR